MRSSTLEIVLFCVFGVPLIVVFIKGAFRWMGPAYEIKAKQQSYSYSGGEDFAKFIGAIFILALICGAIIGVGYLFGLGMNWAK